MSRSPAARYDVNGRTVFITGAARGIGKATAERLHAKGAARAGADLVKFQTFSADRLTTAAAATADYQARNTGSLEPQQAMLRRLELSRELHRA